MPIGAPSYRPEPKSACMCAPVPIQRTMASEFGCTGSRSTRWFHGLSAGNTGQPASTAAPMATLPYNSARVAGWAEAAGLALRQPAVAAHVAVLAARDHVQGRLVADVLDLPDRGRVHAREPTRAEHVLGLVVHADRDPAAVHEVELLLLLVEVAPGLEAGRDLDRVHAEGGDAEGAPDLAETGPVRQRVDAGDGVAVALHHVTNLVCHARSVKGYLRGSLRAPEPAARPQDRHRDQQQDHQ